MNRLAITLCGFILAALPSTSALADTVYTYTGNHFTHADALYFTTTERVSGSFTLSSPLAPNMSLTAITPVQFSFSDGRATFTNATTLPPEFDVATDSTGNIAYWLIYLYNRDNTNDVRTFNTGELVDDAGVAYVNLQGSQYGSYVYNDPGTWTVFTTDSPSPVPEPSSLLMLASGAIGGLGVFRRRLVG